MVSVLAASIRLRARVGNTPGVPWRSAASLSPWPTRLSDDAEAAVADGVVRRRP